MLDRQFFQEHGRRGGVLGGKKASANMTSDQRIARAKKAAAARKWHPVLPYKKVVVEVLDEPTQKPVSNHTVLKSCS